jgi:hypothetical protein
MMPANPMQTYDPKSKGIGFSGYADDKKAPAAKLVPACPACKRPDGQPHDTWCTPELREKAGQVETPGPSPVIVRQGSPSYVEITPVGQNPAMGLFTVTTEELKRAGKRGAEAMKASRAAAKALETVADDLGLPAPSTAEPAPAATPHPVEPVAVAADSSASVNEPTITRVRRARKAAAKPEPVIDPAEETKVCEQCNQPRPLSWFWRLKGGGRRRWCSECMKGAQAEGIARGRGHGAPKPERPRTGLAAATSVSTVPALPAGIASITEEIGRMQDQRQRLVSQLSDVDRRMTELLTQLALAAKGVA